MSVFLQIFFLFSRWRIVPFFFEAGVFTTLDKPCSRLPNNCSYYGGMRKGVCGHFTVNEGGTYLGPDIPPVYDLILPDFFSRSSLKLPNDLLAE